MNNFKTVIGLEVHTVINSKTKMFSSAKSCHTDPVNTNVNEVDVGLPGALPSVNEAVVQKAICLAHALHMQIAHTLSFDRKNYFYRDLPKGFQITQQYNPIGKDGYIEITKADGTKKKICIERIHIEEDTAKQIKVGNKVLLDYNRCGMPLIEIVTMPDMSSGEEAVLFLIELKRILNFCGEISDAKMEEGSLRVDINISIQPYGSEEYGTRVEVKNVNSISNVAKAIAYEEKRQAAMVLSGNKFLQQTRRYDDSSNTTIYMRDKVNLTDYHFIPEGNILQYELDEQFITESLKQIKNSVQDIKNQLRELKIDEKIINQLLDDYPLFKIFKRVFNEVKDANLTITWILIELIGLLKKDNKTIENISHEKIDNIIEMLKLLIAQKINAKQGKTVIAEIYKTNLKPVEIIEKFGFKQITDKTEIEKILKVIIEKNSQMVAQYKERPERVEKMFVGLLMKATQGQANPVISMEVLRSLLKN